MLVICKFEPQICSPIVTTSWCHLLSSPWRSFRQLEVLIVNILVSCKCEPCKFFLLWLPLIMWFAIFSFKVILTVRCAYCLYDSYFLIWATIFSPIVTTSWCDLLSSPSRSFRQLEVLIVNILVSCKCEPCKFFLLWLPHHMICWLHLQGHLGNWRC